MSVLYIIVAGILGMVVGSLLNVCISRLPQDPPTASIGLRCDSCKRWIRVVDVVPVLGYLVLRGRCRDCGARIPRRVVVVQAVSGLTFAALFQAYDLTITFTLMAIYAAILIVVCAINLEHGLILNRVTLASLIFALAVAALVRPNWLGTLGLHPVVSATAGALVGFVLLFVCAVIARGGLGWGLVKFGAFMGAATGFPLVIVALVLAFVFGFATGSFLLISGRKGRREFLQAGPILTASTMATLIWGPQILVLCSGITRLMPF